MQQSNKLPCLLQDHADTIRSIYVGVSAHQKLELLSSLVKLLGYESLAVFGDCFDEVNRLSVAASRGHSSHLKWWQGWQECQGILSLPVLLQGILPGCACWRLPPWTWSHQLVPLPVRLISQCAWQVAIGLTLSATCQGQSAAS